MTAPKLTGFMIGLVLITVAAGIFVSFMSILSVNYNVNYDNTTLTKYADRMEELKTNTEEIKQEATTIKQDPGLLDIIGGYFKSAYSTVIVAAQSFSIFEDMGDDALTDIGFGDDKYSTMKLIKDALITIVIILFTIGIIVAMLVKRDL